jgi:hypothetical protein
MLEELKIYDNLWTPNFYWELFSAMNHKEEHSEDEIRFFFFNKVIDGRSIFDWCLPLLKQAKIVRINDESNKIKKSSNFRDILFSRQLCKQKLLEWFLLALKADEKFFDIFSSSSTSYDLIYKTIQVDYSAFGGRYSNVRRLLLDFDFLLMHPDFPHRKLIVNPWWKKFFDLNFVPEIRKRKVGIDELYRNIEQQQINWEIAEKFVMDFEKSRLNNIEWIQWIAPFDSAAGYDILSYYDINSEENDRFIEVKSYWWNTPYFYWTQNEIRVAKKEKERYCLYLVNRDFINDEKYIPMIISNPCETVLWDKNKWKIEINKYFIQQNTL